MSIINPRGIALSTSAYNDLDATWASRLNQGFTDIISLYDINIFSQLSNVVIGAQTLSNALVVTSNAIDFNTDINIIKGADTFRQTIENNSLVIKHNNGDIISATSASLVDFNVPLEVSNVTFPGVNTNYTLLVENELLTVENEGNSLVSFNSNIVAISTTLDTSNLSISTDQSTYKFQVNPQSNLTISRDDISDPLVTIGSNVFNIGAEIGLSSISISKNNTSYQLQIDSLCNFVISKDDKPIAVFGKSNITSFELPKSTNPY